MKYFHINVVIVCMLMAAACKTKTATYQNNLGIQPAIIAQIDTINYTTVLFEDSVKNTGDNKQGDTVHIAFSFTNSGDHPLYISSVTPGCGCTIVDYTKAMIDKGEKGVISATLVTQTLNGFFRKTVGVVSNTKNSRMHTLVFYGNIKTDSVKKGI